MAWNIRERKTEHAGAKHGCGAYYGPKAIAKRASNKGRRINDRRAAASALGEVELVTADADTGMINAQSVYRATGRLRRNAGAGVRAKWVGRISLSWRKPWGSTSAFRHYTCGPAVVAGARRTT
jgi:hypothetical protein